MKFFSVAQKDAFCKFVLISTIENKTFKTIHKLYHIIQLGMRPTAPWPTRGMPSQSPISEGFSAWHSLNLTSDTRPNLSHVTNFSTGSIIFTKSYQDVLTIESRF